MITHEAQGWDNVVFRVVGRRSVRFPRRCASVALLLNEVTWLPSLVPRLTLPIPQPEFLGTPVGNYPYHWTVFE